MAVDLDFTCHPIAVSFYVDICLALTCCNYGKEGDRLLLLPNTRDCLSNFLRSCACCQHFRIGSSVFLQSAYRKVGGAIASSTV